MAKLKRENFLVKPFSDYQHYPYGFSRSGDFSIRESQALEKYGQLYQALATQAIPAEVAEDKHFLDVCAGRQVPETVQEKAWVKYQARINRTAVGGFNNSKVVIADDELDDVVDDANLPAVDDVDGDLD